MAQVNNTALRTELQQEDPKRDSSSILKVGPGPNAALLSPRFSLFIICFFLSLMILSPTAFFIFFFSFFLFPAPLDGACL